MPSPIIVTQIYMCATSVGESCCCVPALCIFIEQPPWTCKNFYSPDENELLLHSWSWGVQHWAKILSSSKVGGQHGDLCADCEKSCNNWSIDCLLTENSSAAIFNICMFQLLICEESMLFFARCDHKLNILMNASLQVGGIIRIYFSLVSFFDKTINQNI